MILSNAPAKRCHTVSSWTLHEGKTLLVKHKKLGIWLAPGGHVEENELPHQAAEREFEEETGIQVHAISAFPLDIKPSNSEFLPLPFYCNLHEINKPRRNSFCEQHYSWGFFVKIVDLSGFHQDDIGVDAVSWFARDEVTVSDTWEGIKNEAFYVFDHFPSV